MRGRNNYYLNEKVIELARDNDIDYVGIAPVDRFRHAPPGHKPGDILPGAQSVISLGVRVSQGPQLTQRLATADLSDRRLRHISFSYRWFGYGLINQYFLDRTAALVTKLLEKEGQIALPIVASGVEDAKALMATLSNRHAAVAAGLGEFGWNGLCLTPDVGPRARFCSIITTANLDPTPMYHGPKLCDVDRCKKLGNGLPVCLKVCPIAAFNQKRTVEVVIGDRRFEYAWMNHDKCVIAGMGLHPRILGPEDNVIPSKVTFDTAVQLAAKRPPVYSLEGLVFGRGHFCGLCLLRCPVGSPKLVDDIMKGKEKLYS